MATLVFRTLEFIYCQTVITSNLEDGDFSIERQYGISQLVTTGSMYESALNKVSKNHSVFSFF